MNMEAVPLHYSATGDIMNMQHFNTHHLRRTFSTPAMSSSLLFCSLITELLLFIVELLLHVK